jgi:thiol-disulfide isomerase/thioredoxin
MKTRRVRGGKPKTRKNRTSARQGTQLDIIEPKQIAALEKLLKKGVTIVFVYADWCPHCHNYKPTWKDICKSKGRNVNMVAVNEKVLSKTSLPNRTTIEGYPTVIAVNSITGETTNIPNYRDVSAMKNLASNAGNITEPVANVRNVRNTRNAANAANARNAANAANAHNATSIEDTVIEYMNEVEPGINEVKRVSNRTATPYPLEEEKLSVMPPQSDEDFVNTLGYTNEQFTRPVEQRGGRLRRLRGGF